MRTASAGSASLFVASLRRGATRCGAGLCLVWPVARGLTLKAALVALAMTISFAVPAEAQSFNPFNWFQQAFPKYHTPRPPGGYDYRPRRAYELTLRPRRAGRTRATPKVVEKAPQKPAVPPSFFVAVLGDSLGLLLSQGLTEAFADRPEVAVLRKTHQSSGLVRDDFYDWTKAVRELLASGQKINVAVMLIGSNDHQPIHQDGMTYDPGSPKWNEIYASRIENVAGMFRNAKIPLLWVGLPIMRSDRFAAEMTSLNDLYRDHAAKEGATFIDIWDAFSDDNGRYSAFGPNVTGQVVRLRTGNGVYFTKAGARKLAQFVETEVRTILDATKPKDDAALATIETTNPAGISAPNAAVAPPVKPPIGPILPLTGPVLAPGGELATRAGAAEQKGESQKLINETFVTGHALKPKPGRADDFSWPPQ